jgi:PTS system nitrogen regulatory IIA component
MALREVLDHDLIRIETDCRTKDELLERIAVLVAAKVPGIDSTDIDEALKERESLGSTGFGHGVAIPHCRLEEIDDFIVGLLKTPRGIDFESLDGEDSWIFPFVIGPESKPKEHLRLLSALAHMLRDAELRKALRGAKSNDELRNILMDSVIPDHTLPERRPGSKLIHVFVQNEKVFDSLLQVFSATDNAMAMVVEAHESTEYMAGSPLFAGFWNTDVRQFNRIIIAVVRDELTNSTVRSIEYICGKLSERDDIMVTVTDLHYVLGSLGS